jgi:hypothetical protein
MSPKQEYEMYAQLCWEFGQEPQLTEADFYMGEKQEREYKAYRSACRLSGVEPTKADFLLGDIPSCVIREMEWVRQQRPQVAMGAAVGR